MKMVLKAIGVLFALVVIASAQENVQTRLSDYLRDCYEDVYLLNRDSRPPMTMAVLIDLIQKIEDYPGLNANMRQLSLSILHRFRQDGIVYHSTSSRNVLPYSPSGFQFYKHRLLLTRLLPDNQFAFPNSTLSAIQRCTLHHMLSSTIAVESRGDEGSVCSQLSQYRLQRVPRSADDGSDDVEILDRSVVVQFVDEAISNIHLLPWMSDGATKGIYQEMGTSVYLDKINERVHLLHNLNDDVDTFDNGALSERQVAASQCPLEDGVVYTRWGAVAVGPLIAGIAAGLETQQVLISDLVRDVDPTLTLNTASTTTVDNRYAATLAGDLAEAALRQGTVSDTISVGASGGWNATQARRHYFLQQSSGLEATDAEIRGGIDGLILGINAPSYVSTYANLKLSQLLDMYYSNGVFNRQHRACNRQAMMTSVAPTDALQTQTFAFAVALDAQMPLEGTLTSDGREQVSVEAVTSLNSYIPTSLNDLSCATTDTIDTDDRVMTNLYLIVDASFQYANVYPSITYLLDSIEVSKFGSSVTLLNAADGNVVVEKTFSLATFHESYNITVHQSMPTGTNILRTLISLRNLTSLSLDEERTINYNGGNSTIALFLVNTVNLDGDDLISAIEHARIMRELVPDLHLLFATAATNRERLEHLVRDPTADILSVTMTTAGTQLASVYARMRQIPRRLTNPSCGSEWVGTESARRLDDFVELGAINYYRLQPNYFYVSSTTRIVRVVGAGYGQINVCHSRSTVLPRQNSTTSSDVVCQSINTDTLEIRLEGACDGRTFIGECPPLYISVESTVIVSDTTVSTARCTENACRFPTNLKYSIVLENLGCYSGCPGLTTNVVLLLGAVVLALTNYLL